MEKYAQMKNSGINWILDIPSTWGVRVLFQLADQVKNKNKDLSEQNLLSLSYGRIKRKDINNPEGLLPESFDGYNIIESNDIVLRLTDLQNDHTSLRVGQAKERGIITSAYTTLRPSSLVNPQYLYYVLHAYDLIKGFYGMGAGVRQGLNYDEVKTIKVPFPSLEEQQVIVHYLNDQIFQIDSIIKEARSSIEEYDKWKAAILFESLTGKLQKEEGNVKDTRIPWIRVIPSSWKLASLKHMCDEIMDGTHFSPELTDEGVPYLTASDVHGVGINYDSAKRISKADFEKLSSQGCEAYNGDVLLVKDGATTGRVGMKCEDTPCVLLSSVARLKVKDGVNNKYLMYLLMSDVLQSQIKLSMAGSAMPRITLTKLSNFTGIIPPMKDQMMIVKYLDDLIPQVDSTMEEKESLVVDLEKYKRSLIYETVTGKRKVV